MVDHYSKAVFSVIAAALVGLFIQNLIRPVLAEDPKVMRVVICNSYNFNRCARVFEDGNQSEWSSKNFLHTR